MQCIRKIMLVVAVMFLGVVSQAFAWDTIHVACNNQDALEVIAEQGVPIDSNGNPMVGCSLVTSSMNFDNRRVIGGFGVVCYDGEIPAVCPVWVVQATVDGQTLWYEVGMLYSLPLDVIEEALLGIDEDNPILTVGLPDGFEAPSSINDKNEEVLLADVKVE